MHGVGERKMKEEGKAGKRIGSAPPTVHSI